jgi:hypothetical protein
MQKNGQERWSLMFDPLGASIQQKDGRGDLTQYRAAFLHGLRARAKRPANISKIAAVIQKPEEPPTDFYERLCEAF